jgi:hypothetical protein
VFIDSRGFFNKTAGNIYGSDIEYGNAVEDSLGAVKNYRGHAVYAASPSPKIKETTAGPNDNMSYDGRTNPVKISGAWDN